jgi:translation initiation factor IF-2
MAAAVRKEFPGVTLGGGMLSFFTELNRKPAPKGVFDRVTTAGGGDNNGSTRADFTNYIERVPVSALKGQGVTQLLESILLVAEVSELKATSSGVSRASVIEAQIEQGRGPTATLIVRTGTLKIGDAFICGNYSGKIKGLLDDFGKPLKSAGPSTPVKIVGFSGLPNAGDELVVMENEKAASTLSDERLAALRLNKLSVPTRPTLENLFQSIADEQRKSLRILLKSDVHGSSEALVTSLKQIQSKKIDLEILHTAVGPISESDVLLAAASN